MSRYLICVESMAGEAESLEEALAVFSGMMWVNKDQARKQLVETGESAQSYGFCTGFVRDTQFRKAI